MDPAVVTLLAAGVLGAGVSAALRLWELGTAPALDRAWTEAARRVGGRVLVEPPTFWSRAIRRIKVDVEGVALTVDTFTEHSGKSAQHYTRLRAGPLPGLCRVELRVEPRTVFTAITRRLELGEAPTGDGAFDAAFRVESRPAGVGRELLDVRTRALALASEEGFEIHGKTLTIKCRGLPKEAAPLVAIVRYGRALVERWVELARAPAELAAALGLGPVEPRVELAREGATRVAQGARRGREVSLSVRLEGARCVTIASVGVAGGAPFALDRRPSRAASEGEAPAYARALAEGAPPALARVVGEAGCVSLEFEGLAPEPDEVGRLVEAVFEATHGGGAYR